MLALVGLILVYTEFLPVLLPAPSQPAREGDLGCGC